MIFRRRFARRASFKWDFFSPGGDSIKTTLLLATISVRLSEFLSRKGRGYHLWLFSTRYLAPVAVILVFLNAIGALDWMEGIF